jgi:hypothetical protein
MEYHTRLPAHPTVNASTGESSSSTATDPTTDTFVREIIQRYRTKLLDLTSRNPLISFKHSERSRSQIRVVGEEGDGKTVSPSS